MDFDVETLQRQIPFYLTDELQRDLVANLKALAAGDLPNIYLSPYDDMLGDGLYQGDGMRGFEAYLWDSGEVVQARGIVLSNSCDVSTDNKRDLPSRVVFAPLVKLNTYVSLLNQSKLDRDKILAKIDSIKQQRTTNIFYLPAGGPVDEEYLVRLDEVHSMPLARHSSNKTRERLFRLNQHGFYLFALKLSLHFCRLQENVLRSKATT